MIVSWTPRALADATAVPSRISRDDPGAADRLEARLLAVVEETLVAQPHIGRPGRVAETREFVVHPSCILVYRVRGEALELLAFRHVARRWPEAF